MTVSQDMNFGRFFNKVKKTPNCWLFVGGLTDGYGMFQQQRAHRFSYIFHKGKIPKGLYVCHSCDVRNCVNPDHLWLGTHRDNMRDAWAKGRMPPINAKLNQRIANRIRKVGRKFTTQEWADKYGVGIRAIQRIFKNERWVETPR